MYVLIFIDCELRTFYIFGTPGGQACSRGSLRRTKHLRNNKQALKSIQNKLPTAVSGNIDKVQNVLCCSFKHCRMLRWSPIAILHWISGSSWILWYLLADNHQVFVEVLVSQCRTSIVNNASHGHILLTWELRSIPARTYSWAEKFVIYVRIMRDEYRKHVLNSFPAPQRFATLHCSVA